VPDIADWCIVDLLQADGALARVAIERRDPVRRELAHSSRKVFSAHGTYGSGTSAAVEDIERIPQLGGFHSATLVSGCNASTVERSKEDGFSLLQTHRTGHPHRTGPCLTRGMRVIA
jgi:hypothetical protein